MSGLAFVDDHSNPKSDSIIETEADYLDDRHVSANQRKTSGQSEEAIIMGFAENRKAQAATKALFELVHAHGENLREVIVLVYGQQLTCSLLKRMCMHMHYVYAYAFPSEIALLMITQG